jgi:hypothetical protein
MKTNKTFGSLGHTKPLGKNKDTDSLAENQENLAPVKLAQKAPKKGKADAPKATKKGKADAPKAARKTKESSGGKDALIAASDTDESFALTESDPLRSHLLQGEGLSDAAIELLEKENILKKQGKLYLSTLEEIINHCRVQGIPDHEAVIIRFLLQSNLYKFTKVGASKATATNQVENLWNNEHWEIEQNELNPEQILFRGQIQSARWLWYYVHTTFNIDVSENTLLSILDVKAQKFNPIKRWFEAFEHGNCKRGLIDAYAKKVQTATPNFALHLKKHLVRCVKQLFENGLSNKHCLTLIGGQHIGKTSYLLHLFSEPIFEDYIKPNGLEIGHKDSRIDLGRNFAIIFDEADKYVARRDAADIKALLGSGNVSERQHYARNNTAFKRMASFFATANAPILTDETGNVRFLCFDLQAIDFSYRNIAAADIWAEAYMLYKEGYDAALTREELAEMNEHSSFAEIESFELSLLRKHFEPCNDEEGMFIIVADVCSELQSHTPIKLNPVAVGKALTKLCGEKRQKRASGKNVKGYYVKRLHPV